MLALSLGCLSGGSGAMAQNGWENVYAQTETSSADWTKLSSGSSSGITLGSGSATTYYYIDRNLNFTNTNGSGLTITGTVYLYIPYGRTLYCQGSNANERTGAGAGIELPSGNTLYIIGGGTVTATGGNAANGGNGAAGTDADFVYDSWTSTGAGGKGGDGGGGAGAGIGTRGGDGGTGGAGGEGKTYTNWDPNPGTNGRNGDNGATAGAMGTLYVANGITVNATGGSAGKSGGTGGQRGKAAADDDESNNFTMAGGGGGGGGAYGGAAENIGTGGPGGGGGGGGAGGAQEEDNYNLTTVYAPGGYGAYNLDGSQAGNGADGHCDEWSFDNGWVKQNNGFKGADFTEVGDVAMGSAGSYGSNGNDASAGTQHEGSLTYNVTYTPIKTKLNSTDLTPRVVTYNAGVGSVILPENADGYQWVLSVYGKSCAPSGTSASQFATPTKNYFGGHGTTELERTVVLANVYGDIEFQEIPTQCKLNNSGNNTQLLAEYVLAEYPVTVRLKDRTLYKDGDWNTLCLPFNMTAAQIELSPLAGATIYKMDEENTNYYPGGYLTYNYPVLYFRFANASNSDPVIQAGKPYLVKWTEKDETIDGNLVDNTKKGGSRHELDFENVMVSATTAGNWSGNNITFQGTLQSSGDLIKGDKTKLVLGKNNMLYYPGEDMNIGACRGYFVIPQSVANLLPPDNPSNARQFVMSFDDGGETTSIQTFNVTPESQNDAPVYNLNGQRLSAPKKGINIVNGKKVLVK